MFILHGEKRSRNVNFLSTNFQAMSHLKAISKFSSFLSSFQLLKHFAGKLQVTKAPDFLQSLEWLRPRNLGNLHLLDYNCLQFRSWR